MIAARKKIAIGLAAAVCAAAAVSGGIALYSPALAEWDDAALRSEYAYGETLSVPLRRASVGGQVADAVSTVKYPDGTSTLKTELALDMAGEYTVSYTAALGGRTYKTEESFSVYDGIYRVGPASSAEYGRHEKSKSTDGVMVSLAQGDTLQFTQLIDLTDATKDQPVVEAFAVPATSGILEFSRLEFTLTDAEDSSCYLRVSARQSSEGITRATTYFLAGGNGQQMKGYEEYWNRLHVENEWGTQTPHSFYGWYGGPTEYLDSTKISIRYDAETKCVYTNNTMIIDLDNPEYFTTLWTGFKSGKVRLSITADLYESTYANFVVSTVKGVDLSQERLEDTQAPEIAIDTPYEKAPDAKTGCSYPVPGATAKDDYSGIVDVSVSVWFDYASENALTVAVKDGRFTTARAGKYAIVYRARDRVGNTAERAIVVDCRDEVGAIELALSEDRETETFVGDYVALPEASASGGSGMIALSYAAVLNGKEIPVEEGGFRPVEEGVYEIVCRATDYIGQYAEEKYTLNVVKAEKPIFTGEPELPRYFLAGCEYTVPSFFAQDYTSGSLKMLEATLTVTDAGGEQTLKAGDVYTPAVMRNGDVAKLVFTAGAAVLEREVVVIRPYEAEEGRLKLSMENYLVSADASYEKTDDAIIVTAHSANTSFTFANKLLAEGLSVTLNAIPEKSYFKGLKITLTDGSAPADSVEFELVYDGRSTYLKAGERLVETDAGFQSSARSHVFELGYADGYVSVGSMTLSIGEYADGRKFGGFASGFLYLTAAFIDAEAGAAYSVSNINSQPISNVATDRIRPKILLFGEYGDAVAQGETIVLPSALAGDVLNPCVSLSLTVVDPAGNIVVSKDGVALSGVRPDRQYAFEAGLYGSYQVSYVATDSFSEKSQTVSFVVTVEDRTPPEIAFSQEFLTTVGLGDVIVIPDFSVTDNLTASENIRVEKYILTSGGRLVYLPEGSNSFRAASAGVYQVRIVAVDEAGNIFMFRVQITVTE